MTDLDGQGKVPLCLPRVYPSRTVCLVEKWNGLRGLCQSEREKEGGRTKEREVMGRLGGTMVPRNGRLQ